MKPVTKKDWDEIVYVLNLQIDLIQEGHYGLEMKNFRWIKTLSSILEKAKARVYR